MIFQYNKSFTVLLLVGCNEYLDTCCTQRPPTLELLVTAAHSILQLLQLLKKYEEKNTQIQYI